MIASFNRVVSSPPDWVLLPVGEAIPVNVHFVSCEYSYRCRLFELVVCHPSFEICPIGSEIPEIGHYESLQGFKLVDGEYVPRRTLEYKRGPENGGGENETS